MSEAKKSTSAAREEETLRWWQEREIFEKSLEKPSSQGDYVFYDGPPFATGLPHYGHILASVVKDAVPRYWTMRGYHVPRVWGWDCHGLPIENIVEKELGFRHKKDIEKMGVEKFNEMCRARVLTYVNEWEKVIPRIGRWADMKNAYRTMDKPYMESVWWVFKQLWDKGLVYEDYRSMHICPRCETTLSQQEVSEGYKDVKDIAVTVKFKVKNPEKIGLSGDVYLLAWTTTPWTLPGNVALAVGDSIRYAKFTVASGETYIVAKERLSSIFGDQFGKASTPVEQWPALGLVDGSELVGLEYEPPFDYYAKDEKLKNRENGWKVYAADFITAEDGTGIAHEAPAFGADDWELAKKKNLPFVQHVNFDGTMKAEVVDFAGEDLSPRAKGKEDEVREIDLSVKKYLEQKGLLFAWEKHSHSYPHCWRCDTPLLNYATSSWFVAVTKIKADMLENAERIHWSPEHIKEGRWGQWLKGARDWSISRQRFWASVMPIWRCEKCKSVRVFGSVHELEEASGQKVEDLHKHVVDKIVFTCWECDGEMHRVPDVLDTWFDSGSMPYAERHYPFENKEEFERSFPAQFIAESLDQTRAWFYYLHVLASGIFGRNAFQNVIVNGIVLAEDGKKMSKKLKNYPDPMEVVEKYGADALRFYLLTSPVARAENLSFAEKGVDEVAKKNIGRLLNVVEFYKLYDDGTPRDWRSEHVLDTWIIARLDALIAEATKEFNAYHLDGAARPLTGFIDDLSVWYLRRSRERFKDDGEDKKLALATLRFVLHRLSLVMAPIMPFLAEHVFQTVREGEDEESVHLASWPEKSHQPSFWMQLFGGSDARLVLEQMEVVRNVVSKALEERDRAGIAVRQPLPQLTIESTQLAEGLIELIRDEVNVKRVIIGDTLALDTTITDELREEGVVRAAIRTVQAARKDAKLNPKDHATLVVDFAALDMEAVKRNLDHIQKETNTTIQL
jgi:isoleucyl-tRNA synthetase